MDIFAHFKKLNMKTIFFSFISPFFILICFSRCQPDRNTFGTYYSLLKADINKTSEAVALGDTLKFTLQWPDVLQTSTLNGDTRTDNVSSLQEAWYAYRIFRIDTINNTVYSSSGEGARVDFFLSEGYEIQPCQPCYVGTVYLQRSSKPFRGVLNIVPKVKGLFYIEIRPQAGAFKINNNFEGLFKVDFNVTNKHANLVAPYLTNWETVVQQRGQEGFGIYCFKVI